MLEPVAGSTDWNGIAVVIAAVAAAFVSIGTFFMQWKAKRTHDVDKSEAVAARTEQTAKIDEVHKAINNVAITAETKAPPTTPDPDNKGP